METRKNVFTSRTSVRARLHAAALGRVSLIALCGLLGPLSISRAQGVDQYNQWGRNAFDAMGAQMSGNSTTYGGGTAATRIPVTPDTNLSGWKPAGNFGVATPATGPTVTVGANFKGAGGAAMKASATIPKASILAGMGTIIGNLAKRSIPLFNIAMAAKEIGDLLDASDVELNNPNGVVDPNLPFKWPEEGSGFLYRDELWGGDNWSVSAQAAAEYGFSAFIAAFFGSVGDRGSCQVTFAPGGGTTASCPYRHPGHGQMVNYDTSLGKKVGGEVRYRTGNWADIRPKYEGLIGDAQEMLNWQLDAAKRAEQNGIDLGWGVNVTKPNITGPSSLPQTQKVETTTSNVKGDDGITREVTTTKTTTTTNPLQYGGDTVKVVPTATTTTTTVTKNPDGSTTTDTQTDTTTTETTTPTEQEQKDLCLLHPDILACAKPELDTPDGEIPKEDKTITYQEENMFGAGSCPADAVMTLGTMGKTVTVWDWRKTCEYALPLRAIVVALASFAAFLILMPGGGNQT